MLGGARSPGCLSVGRGSAGPAPRRPLSLALQMEAVKQGVDQKLVEGQEKLHQMWLSWNQKQLQGVEGDPGKPEVAVARGGARGAGCRGPGFLLHPSARWTDQPAGHASPNLASLSLPSRCADAASGKPAWWALPRNLGHLLVTCRNLLTSELCPKSPRVLQVSKPSPPHPHVPFPPFVSPTWL